MLEPGARVPEARVWVSPGDRSVDLRDAIAGPGRTLLCFYPFDWSPGCANELRLLRDRHDDLAEAGVRVYGISLDSPWSHRAWAEALALDGLLLLSDALGEAASAFEVLSDSVGIPKADRSAFLVRDGRVEASWLLDSPLLDVDAILSMARA